MTAPAGATSMKVDLSGNLFSGWMAFDDVVIKSLTVKESKTVTKYYYPTSGLGYDSVPSASPCKKAAPSAISTVTT